MKLKKKILTTGVKDKKVNLQMNFMPLPPIPNRLNFKSFFEGGKWGGEIGWF